MLYFGYRNRSRGTGLNAAFAAQALVFGYHYGFAVLHLKGAGGTDVDTFFIAGAFIHIHFNPPSH
jgi:hypothetical protein